MTIYNKPDAQIFAKEAKQGEITTFPDIARGWGVTLDTTNGIPPMEFFNALQNRTDEALGYLMQRGVAEWREDLEYPKHAITILNGQVFFAKQQNTNKNPFSNPEIWVNSFAQKANVEDVYNKQEIDDLIGAQGATSIENLRTIEPKSDGERITLLSYYEGGTTGGGEFVADIADGTTEDNGGTVIVTSKGNRWKRILINNEINLEMFGNTDFHLVVLACENKILNLFNKTITLNAHVKMPENIEITGKGAVIRSSQYEIQCHNNNKLTGNVSLTCTSSNPDTTVGVRFDPRAFNSQKGLENLLIDGWKVSGFFYNITSRTNDDANVGVLRNKNVMIKNCHLIANKDGKVGNILIRETDVCTIKNNIVFGGTTSSAIGASYKSSNLLILNNKITDNIEASIQIENCDNLKNNKVQIEGNLCDGAIWCDDSSNVIVSENIADSLIVTYQHEIVDNVKILNNIKLGTIEVQNYGVADTSKYINNLMIANNVISGAIGYWDGKLKSNNHGIFLNSKVRVSSIKNNIVDSSKFTNDITVSANNNNVNSTIVGNKAFINVAGAITGKIYEYNNLGSSGLIETRSISDLFLKTNAFNQVLSGVNFCTPRKLSNIKSGQSGLAYFKTVDLPVSGFYSMTVFATIFSESTGAAYITRSAVVENKNGSITIKNGEQHSEINGAQFVLSMGLNNHTVQCYVRNNSESVANAIVSCEWRYIE